MRVLGIDPGLRKMGWGIIDVQGNKLNHVANGVCKSEGDDLATRLLCLFDQVEEVLQTWHPTQAAVENTFINKDGVNSLKLAQARAIALLVPKKFGLNDQNLAHAFANSLLPLFAVKTDTVFGTFTSLPSVKIATAPFLIALLMNL